MIINKNNRKYTHGSNNRKVVLMSKFGDGLNIEFIRAVKNGQISEPFTKADVDYFATSKGWHPSPRYVNVMLANGSSPAHSLTYKKYFEALGNGEYRLSKLAWQEILSIPEFYDIDQTKIDNQLELAGYTETCK